MSKTYIIGHQKPDTDSVVSALALEHLFKQAPSFNRPNAQALISDPVNSETQYLLDKFQIEAPPLLSSVKISAEDQVILVDHNEASQRASGFGEAQISEIIDHHKVNLNLNKPIFLNFKAWGSTTSIIYFMMKRFDSQSIVPNKKLAGLMTAAILSDTIGLKSPTTCEIDQKYAQQLSQIAEINNLDEFSLEIFKAKSNITHLSPVAIVKNDYKIFQFAKPTFIGQVETVEQEEVLSHLDELIMAMKKVKQEEQIDLIFLAITDILRINTKLIFPGEKEQQIAQSAFGGQAHNHILDIGPKLSRKKEIAPAIEQSLKDSK